MTEKQSRNICIVVQRYGEEVNGGAELLARQIAEKLVKDDKVTVLSSKAVDYMSWADEYTSDSEVLNGVTVKRFSVNHPRNFTVFNAYNNRFMNGLLPEEEEKQWVIEEGPYVPEMLNYLKEHKDQYDVFLFFTYLYYPTVMGIPEVAEKSIVFPLAHDEPFLKMRIFDNVFALPKAFVFETEEERKLIRRKYHNYYIPGIICGAGVDVPKDINNTRFREKYHLTSKYIVYIGRIDTGKNCEQLFNFFLHYKKKNPSDLKLVLIGKPVISVPDDSNIISLGFVSEEDKYDALAGSEFLVLPSKYESLSLVVLESFSLSVPVLVNGECEVLKSHCEISHGGFYYLDYEQFSDYMDILLHEPKTRTKMGAAGKKYVENKFDWDIILYKLHNLIEMVSADQW